MSLQLKLDATAVASLFPEGSDVRLELQQAVINETVRRFIDRELSKTREYIATKCKEVAEDALAKEGITSKVWSGTRLSDAYVERLRASTKEAAIVAFHNAMTETLAPYMADMDKRIKAALDEGLRIRMNAMAKQALMEALK